MASWVQGTVARGTRWSPLLMARAPASTCALRNEELLSSRALPAALRRGDDVDLMESEESLDQAASATLVRICVVLSLESTMMNARMI